MHHSLYYTHHLLYCTPLHAPHVLHPMHHTPCITPHATTPTVAGCGDLQTHAGREQAVRSAEDADEQT